MSRLRFAMVCASNMNRSMQAHKHLKEAGLQVESFGVGQHVKLPGPAADKPNVYEFGVPYKHIYNDLMSKDPELYRRNKLLEMLQRNSLIKHAPEKWQLCEARFDVVLTFEERVMDQVVAHLNSREQSDMQSVLVINLEVKDNHEAAANAAPMAVKLCQMLEAAQDWEDEIDSIISSFEADTRRHPIYTVCFY